MRILITILSLSVMLSSELEVDGDLKVTGTIENDSLAQVIANLQAQIQMLQNQIAFLQQELGIGLVDCMGVIGGDALVDVCGVCDGNGQSCGVFDVDSTFYFKVLLGDQYWLNSNLKTLRYRDGSQIEAARINTESSSGYFYDWYAATDPRGICPEGYHVPSDAEFVELEIFLGMSEEEANSFGWRGDIARIFEDYSGFNLVYAGNDHPSIGITGVGIEAVFSTTNEESENYQIVRLVDINRDDVHKGGFFKNHKMSIRCIQD